MLNISHIIPRLLGVNAVGKVNELISTYLIVYITNRIVALFSQTFLIVYLLTLTDVQLLGLLLAIAAIFEGVIDFPSAGLSKRIGHQWVYAIGMFFLAVAFFLLSYTQTITILIIVLILRAIGKSQQSGVIQSYFDESYSLIGLQDFDRSTYNTVLSRTTLLIDLFGYFSAFVGAYLAVQLQGGRILVFRYQAYGFLALAVLAVLIMRNYGKESIGYDRVDQSSRQKVLPLLFSPPVFFMTLGVIAFFVVKEIWFGFIMWPIYFAYTGDDFTLSIMNMIIFVVSTVVLVLFVKNRQGDRLIKGLPLLTLFYALIAFLPVIWVTTTYPLNDTYQQIPVIILITAGTISLILSITIIGTLYRILLDLIPRGNNSGYHSLLPSVTLLLLAPLYYFSGRVIDNFGYAYVLVVLILSLIGGAGLFLIAIYFFKVGVSDERRIIETDLPFISKSSLSSVTFSLGKYASPVGMGDMAATIWMTLVKIANEDDVITENEMELLIESMKQINSYSDKLRIAVADNILTDEERKHLLEMKYGIIRQLYEFAEISDEVIDQDEQAILDFVDEIFMYLQY